MIEAWQAGTIEAWRHLRAATGAPEERVKVSEVLAWCELHEISDVDSRAQLLEEVLALEDVWTGWVRSSKGKASAQGEKHADAEAGHRLAGGARRGA
jgi:hypothetical protein